MNNKWLKFMLWLTIVVNFISGSLKGILNMLNIEESPPPSITSNFAMMIAALALLEIYSFQDKLNKNIMNIKDN